MIEAATVVSLLGVLGIGSVIGQYLGSSQDRRRTSADALKALRTVEEARWVGPPEEGERPAFRPSMRDLEAAALVARVPRGAVSHYRKLATAAWWESQRRWEEEGDDEVGGYIPTWLGDAVSDAAEELSHVTWRPWIGRVGSGRRIARHRKDLEAVEDGRAKRMLDRALDRA